MSPKRRTSRVGGIRISAGLQHIASRGFVKEKIHQIMKNFLFDCLGSARASRAGEGAPPSRTSSRERDIFGEGVENGTRGACAPHPQPSSVCPDPPFSLVPLASRTSPARRTDQRYDLAFIPAIHPKILVHRDDAMVRVKFAHPDETEIGQIGLPISVAFCQLR